MNVRIIYGKIQIETNIETLDKLMSRAIEQKSELFLDTSKVSGENNEPCHDCEYLTCGNEPLVSNYFGVHPECTYQTDIKVLVHSSETGEYTDQMMNCVYERMIIKDLIDSGKLGPRKPVMGKDGKRRIKVS